MKHIQNNDNLLEGQTWFSRPQNIWIGIGKGLFLIACATLAGWISRKLELQDAVIVLGYMIAVLFTARWTTGYASGIIASIISPVLFNYFFVKPYFTFSVYDPSYWITFGVMAVSSMMVSALITRIGKQEQAAILKELATQSLYNLTSALNQAHGIEEIKKALQNSMDVNFHCQAQIDLQPSPASPSLQSLQPDFSTTASGTARIPLKGSEGILGYVELPKMVFRHMNPAAHRLFDSMLESTAMALSRHQAVQDKLVSEENALREHDRANLLRSISHDFRTPLASMMGTSEMIMDTTSTTDPRYGWSSAIHKDAYWLHGLVENILNLTRLEDDSLHLEKQTESAEEIIGAAVENFEHHHPECQVIMTLSDPMLMMDVDATLITQVLDNLLENAARHGRCEQKEIPSSSAQPDLPDSKPQETESAETPLPVQNHVQNREEKQTAKTSLPAEIELDVHEDPDRHQVVMTIRDHGPGIADEDLPHIFEKFYTSSRNRMPDTKRGIGLGLAICESIIKAHDGTITAENVPGHKGAQFMIRLPLQEESR